ncbi:MAG: hypothetical protein HZB67_00925 [Candidatus Aenigmarchaeota archaeon]|nr:hypothetical protein [Candidatus Aenigmarchaeota archaeon]
MNDSDDKAFDIIFKLSRNYPDGRIPLDMLYRTMVRCDIVKSQYWFGQLLRRLVLKDKISVDNFKVSVVDKDAGKTNSEYNRKAWAN